MGDDIIRRQNMIINYFIIIQMFNYNREKSINFFNKYKNLLHGRFIDCFFEVEIDDQKLFNKYIPAYEETAKSVFDGKSGNILFVDDYNFPEKLKKNANFPPVLFYFGNVELLNRKSISVVGTRNPSEIGEYNAQRIAKFLMYFSLVIVSGLAKGIDGITHHECYINNYKNLIGVVGTPLKISYPKENKELQEFIKKNGLLISEYSFFENVNKLNFLRRNYIMSVISTSTIVIEAGDTSGTINQARNTLKQGKNLYIPKSVFENKDLKWPKDFKYEYKNVYFFESYLDLESLFIKSDTL